MKGLTDIQRETLNVIKEFIKENQHSPSRVELAKHFGVLPGAIQFRLEALAKKGYLEIPKGVHRGMKILKGEENDQ